MSPIKLKLFVALHVLVALAFFGTTLWIASHARQVGGANPRSAAAAHPATAPPATAGPTARDTQPANAGARTTDLPDWLRQSQGRDLERPIWPH